MTDTYLAEEERIACSNLQKKNFAQTAVQTTHFLKKCVIQPIKEILDAEETGSPQSQALSHPFRRGVMEFEDYNYAQFNDYILVSDKKLAVQAAIKDSESVGGLAAKDPLREA